MEIGTREKKRLLSLVKKRKVGRVLLHFPAGFFDSSLVEKLEKSCEVFVWSEPCFGACDVPFFGARELGADLIVSFGHSELKYPEKGIPVEFVELKADGRIDNLPLFEPKTRIGLIFTVQFLEQFRLAKRLLRRKGRKAIVGGHGKMCKYPGQITGCDVESASSIAGRVDRFLLVGQEKFHALEVATLGKPVTVFDPATGRTESFEPVQKKRNMSSLVHEKQSFGILLSIKPGQKDTACARKLKRLLEDSGKRATIFAGDTFTGNLQNFGDIGAFVTTACPRMKEDGELFGRPVLTSGEVLDAIQTLSR